jgi:putative two-component system response regulator
MICKERQILIVDDEAPIRKLLRKKLTSAGYPCLEADSGEQAFARLENGDFGLLILDVNMPGKSGLDLLPELKMNYPDTAIIMATAVAETSIAVECMKRGAEDYICKPFNLDEVVMSVERTFDKRELQLKIKEYQRSLEQKVGEQTDEIRKLFLGAIESLVFALEAKDKYTGGHSRRVADIAVALGMKLGLKGDEISDLRWAGLLHDVGKIAVDQMIQNKPGKLNREEYEHIMIHAHVGAGIVKPVVNESVVEIIEHHHDHYDGTGLHQTVAGEKIPLGARILAVADSYDAMTSDRPYRAALSQEEAFKEIEICSGTQFDPDIAAAFLNIRGILHSEKYLLQNPTMELLEEII